MRPTGPGDGTEALAPTHQFGVTVPETAAKHEGDVIGMVGPDEAGPAVVVQAGAVRKLVQVDGDAGVCKDVWVSGNQTDFSRATLANHTGPERCPATLRTGSIIRMSPMTSVNLSLTSSGVLASLRYSSVIRLLASGIWNRRDQEPSGHNPAWPQQRIRG